MRAFPDFRRGAEIPNRVPLRPAFPHRGSHRRTAVVEWGKIRPTLGPPPASELLEFTITAPRPLTTTRSIPYWNGDIDAEVQAAARGDELAVTRLLTHLQPLLTRYCRARTSNGGGGHCTAEDVAQEISLGVLRALPGLHGRKTPFLPFVYGIAAHKVSDAVRAASRERSDLWGDVPDTRLSHDEPEKQALRTELSTALGTLLGRLQERHREVLVLRIVLGLSSHETARCLGTTPGAVRVTQHRALGRLRCLLDADRGLVPL